MKISFIDSGVLVTAARGVGSMSTLLEQTN
jgi:hypothetical protein